MQINRTKNLFFILTTFTMAFILLLGSWWLYLTFKLSNELESLGLRTTNGNILRMVKWEGSVFLGLIILITFSLMYMYIADRKKSQSINLFFASLTHELKTPLASIKLQAQVLSDLIESLNLSKEDQDKIQKYVTRLHESSFKLEHEMDKHLQLSRIERDGILNPKEIDPVSQINTIARDFDEIEILIESDKSFIQSDEFAFNLIIRNIFENILRHNHNSTKKVHISITQQDKAVHLKFRDNGKKFDGDLKMLGSLFYKHNSPKGSGLGLYMIKKLMLKMKGKFLIRNEKSLIIELVFKK